MPTTTRPSSSEVVLPDCARFPDDVSSEDLTDLLDRSALIRVLAEQGVRGAEALLEERAQNDARLAERLARLRERLRRQASRRIGRILEEYDRRSVDLELVSQKSQAEIAAEVEALEARLRAARSLDLRDIADSDLLAEVQKALLLPRASWNQPPRRSSVWARLRAFFHRVVEFFRRLFSKKRPSAAPTRPGRTVTFAVAAEGRGIGSSLVAEALARLSPPQQSELRESVQDALRTRERDLRRDAEAKRRDAAAQRRRLEEEKEEARRKAERESESQQREAERHRFERELKERGLVAERSGELAVTYGLIERFARLILEEENRSLPADVRLSLKGLGATGIYEKARLRQAEEVAHLDLTSSLLAARLAGLRHIDESTSFVFREVTSERVHVVLAFDKSGSMAESGKLEAAKKALLALYIAVRRRHPDATIDVVAFDNETRLLDLVELWESRPGSFTNTGEALHLAHVLLRPSRATRKEVYLITDGLPESYTDREGRIRSGQLEAAMEHALARAQELATVPGIRFSMVLLRSDHPEYEAAARAITRALSGDLIVTDPQSLGVELLVRWARGSETTRRPTEGARLPAPLPGAFARTTRPGRRRKADRRMGG